MMWFKSCPRCETGDLVLERDSYGWAFQCLHCGFMKDVPKPEHAKSILESLDRSRRPAAVA